MSAVYLRNIESGRIHAGERRGPAVPGAPIMTYEADNLDDAGAREEISLAEAMAAPADALCGRCFPDGEIIDIPAPATGA